MRENSLSETAVGFALSFLFLYGPAPKSIRVGLGTAPRIPFVPCSVSGFSEGYGGYMAILWNPGGVVLLSVVR